MDTWLKVGVWTIVGIVLFWVVLQVVSAILSFVTWLVSMIITLIIIAAILILAYLVLSRLIRGSGGSSTATERERIYE